MRSAVFWQSPHHQRHAIAATLSIRKQNMSKTLRTLAAAAVIAVGLTQAANAALTTKTIDFEGIADGTDLTGALNPYNTSAFGFTTFSGSAAALATEDANFNPTTAVWSPCPAQGSCTGVQASLTITVGQLFHGDGGTAGLTLDVGNSDALSYEIFDAQGGILKSGDFSPPTGGTFRPDSVFIAFTGIAKSITFTGAAAGFKIDNLSFSVDTATTNPVPEPATAALVAVALAGVAALRRKA
jgi:hypothetical protein